MNVFFSKNGLRVHFDKHTPDVVHLEALHLLLLSFPGA